MTGRTAANRDHWDAVYRSKGEASVSWFQPHPTVSLELIETTGLQPTQPIIDVGGGASQLADQLLERGHTDVTVLDVSRHALELARRRLAACEDQVHWVVADLLSWTPPRRFALWHDRAVFHFLTSPGQRARYCRRATTSIISGGYLIVATFASDGPAQCSGMPVDRYSPDDLAQEFNPAFDTVTTRRENHRTPAGADQPFTWVLLRRT
ncbi:MAG: class I SAM-dependent methyltransferase [Streptosporangiales bacterium]